MLVTYIMSQRLLTQLILGYINYESMRQSTNSEKTVETNLFYSYVFV